jgi:hypothetical protein
MSESPVFWERYMADLQKQHVRALSHIQHLNAALQTAQAMNPAPVIALVHEFARALEAMSAHGPGCYACVRVDGEHVYNCPVPMLLAEAEALGWAPSTESE